MKVKVTFWRKTNLKILGLLKLAPIFLHERIWRIGGSFRIAYINMLDIEV